MATLSLLKQLIPSFTDEELVEFLSEIIPIGSTDLKKVVQDTFAARQFSYVHLLNEAHELELRYPLRLVDGYLFETSLPRPPQVSPFYSVIWQLAQFLAQHPLLSNKRLVTFDYILDQIYLTRSDEQVIASEDLSRLSSKDVFIGLRCSEQTFQNAVIWASISSTPCHVIVDQGPRSRGLYQAEVYLHGEVVAVWKSPLIFS